MIFSFVIATIISAPPPSPTQFTHPVFETFERVPQRRKNGKKAKSKDKMEFYHPMR
jgi:hypothetical protein